VGSLPADGGKGGMTKLQWSTVCAVIAVACVLFTSDRISDFQKPLFGVILVVFGALVERRFVSK
jgi:hypothetical protein